MEKARADDTAEKAQPALSELSATTLETQVRSNHLDAPESLRWLTTYLNPWQRCKLGYFGMFLASSGFVPFAGMIFADVKLYSPSEVGMLSAFRPISTLLIVPVASFLADSRGWQSEMFIVSCFAACASVWCVANFTSHFAVAVAVALFYASTAPINTLFDEHVISIVGDENRKYYGGIRVFGTYSWAIGATTASLLCGRFGWTYLWIQYWFGMGLLLLAFLSTPVRIVAHPQHYHEGFTFVKSHKRIQNALWALCVMGCGYTIISTFLFVYLKQELDAADICLGLSVVLTVAIEVPLFQFSQALHRRFTDQHLLSAAMFSWTARVWGYSLLQNAWHVLFLEPLHGFTFGCMWLSGVHLFSSTFPKKLAHTAFGFLYASSFGVGPLVGNILGGYLYEAIGPRWMFRWCGLVMIIAALCYTVIERRLMRVLSSSSAAIDEEMQQSANNGEGLLPVVDVVGVVGARGMLESPRHKACDEDLSVARAA